MSVAALSEKLAGAGFALVDIPVLLGMDDFLRISGEEFRRRIFVTQSQRGEDYCLRPEFTIPVCRRALKDGGSGGRYFYSGKIFRNGRPGEADEVWQMGAEIIGAHDPAAADAEILKQARDAVAVFGVADPRMTVGDVGLFAALLAALGIPAAWARRLTAQFGDPAKVVETARRMTERQGFSGFRAQSGIVAALASLPQAEVGELFAELLATGGVQTVGARSTAEIAERVLEQASLAAEPAVPEETAALIERFLAIEGPLDAAIGAVEAFSATLPAPSIFLFALDRLKARAEALAGLGLAPETLAFRAGFGRTLGYYDGFVFDLHDPRRPNAPQLAGGGRYDGLARAFGSAPDVRAVGFAIWTERFGGAR
jgi:ATP phosphoribosyltransferase regulatory subunit